MESQIDTTGEDPIHNAVLLVEAPGFKWKGAAGLADGKRDQFVEQAVEIVLER